MSTISERVVDLNNAKEIDAWLTEICKGQGIRSVESNCLYFAKKNSGDKPYQYGVHFCPPEGAKIGSKVELTVSIGASVIITSIFAVVRQLIDIVSFYFTAEAAHGAFHCPVGTKIKLVDFYTP